MLRERDRVGGALRARVHRDLEPVAVRHGIRFEYVPVTRETKAEAEARQLALLREAGADFVVLARNPLVDITNTLSTVAVVADGRYFSPRDLDRMRIHIMELAGK